MGDRAECIWRVEVDQLVLHSAGDRQDAATSAEPLRFEACSAIGRALVGGGR